MGCSCLFPLPYPPQGSIRGLRCQHITAQGRLWCILRPGFGAHGCKGFTSGRQALELQAFKGWRRFGLCESHQCGAALECQGQPLQSVCVPAHYLKHCIVCFCLLSCCCRLPEAGGAWGNRLGLAQDPDVIGVISETCLCSSISDGVPTCQKLKVVLKLASTESCIAGDLTTRLQGCPSGSWHKSPTCGTGSNYFEEDSLAVPTTGRINVFNSHGPR